MSEVLRQSELDNRTKTTITHPDFGHVVFSSPTSRQKQILAHYEELVKESSEQPQGRQYDENGVSKLDLTTMETEVLTTLISELYAEPGFSDVGVADLVTETVPMTSMKGVVSSLIKKGIISVDDIGASCPLVFLSYDYYYLHSEDWNAEANSRI